MLIYTQLQKRMASHRKNASANIAFALGLAVTKNQLMKLVLNSAAISLWTADKDEAKYK